MPYLGRQIPLLRIHRLDVIARQREFVEHRHQFTALEFGLDLPGGPPANPQALAHPTIQQLAIITGQIAIDPHRDRLVVAHENPAALLPALRSEERLVGEACDSTCRSRRERYN